MDFRFKKSTYTLCREENGKYIARDKFGLEVEFKQETAVLV